MVALDSGLVKTVMLKVLGDGGDANKVLDEIAAKAEALKELHPELAVQIDRAKAQAEALVAKAEMRRVFGDGIEVPIKLDIPSLPWTAFKQRLLTDLAAAGGFGGGPGGGGGIGGIFKNIFTGGGFGLPGGIVAGVGITGLISSLQVVSGLVASALGLGAFGALSYPTVSGIVSGYSTQKADQAAIQAATTPQQRATAMLKYQQDLEAVDPAQQKVINGIGQLVTKFQDMATAFEPVVVKMAPKVLDIAGKFLDVLPKFANAVAPAISQLLGAFDKFISSPAGRQFEQTMLRLAGPSTLAIGQAIGAIAAAILKLLTVLGQHPTGVVDTIKAIGLIVAGSINTIAVLAAGWSKNWASMIHDVRNWYNDFKAIIGAVPAAGKLAIDQFMKFWRNIPNDLRQIGHDAINGFIAGLRESGLGGISSVVGGIVSFFKGRLGIRSPSTVFAEIGRNSWDGFRVGMTQAAGGLSLNVSGAGGRGGYGGGAVQLQVLPGADALMAEFVARLVRQYVIAHGGGSPASVQRSLGQSS